MNDVTHKPGKKDQHGAALLEFAVLLPLLVILLFGMVEFGRALLQANTLTKAVTTGARYLARYPDLLSDSPHCNRDCTDCADWNTAVAQAEILIENDNAGAGSVILPGLDAGGAITFDRDRRLMSVSGNSYFICVIEVQASTPFVSMSGGSLVPFFQVGPINLIARAEERYLGE